MVFCPQAIATESWMERGDGSSKFVASVGLALVLMLALGACTEEGTPPTSVEGGEPPVSAPEPTVGVGDRGDR